MVLLINIKPPSITIILVNFCTANFIPSIEVIASSLLFFSFLEGTPLCLKIQHIFWEGNKSADSLANKGVEGDNNTVFNNEVRQSSTLEL